DLWGFDWGWNEPSGAPDDSLFSGAVGGDGGQEPVEGVEGRRCRGRPVDDDREDDAAAAGGGEVTRQRAGLVDPARLGPQVGLGGGAGEAAGQRAVAARQREGADQP